MIYDWYLIFNSNDFQAQGLVSKVYTLELENIGIKEVLVTSGNAFGITYEGVYLQLNLNAKNPFEFDGYAIFSSNTGDVYLGIAVNEG